MHLIIEPGQLVVERRQVGNNRRRCRFHLSDGGFHALDMGFVFVDRQMNDIFTNSYLFMHTATHISRIFHQRIQYITEYRAVRAALFLCNAIR